MTFVFDLPLLVTGPLIVLLLVGFALGGLTVFRRRVLPRLRFGESDAHFSGAMVASIMVFYGLAMALIAVRVWETYGEVEKIASREATSLAELYRDVSEYPEPRRTALRDGLREYVHYVITVAWPEQRRGKIPGGGVERWDRIQATLMRFEPATEGQRLLAAETLAAYNRNVEARRLRIDAVNTHLPGVMWMVIVLGAAVSLVAAYFFPVLDPRLHRTQVGLLATFIGMIIFMILAFDRPFRGDLGLEAKPFEIVYEQLMNR